MGFAGDDVELAKYYPEDNDFLLEFEPRVIHYEVVDTMHAGLKKRVASGKLLGEVNHLNGGA